MIRICRVDDQTRVRQGIKSLLALDGEMEVVAEAADGKQAVELIPRIGPDVVLGDRYGTTCAPVLADLAETVFAVPSTAAPDSCGRSAALGRSARDCS